MGLPSLAATAAIGSISMKIEIFDQTYNVNADGNEEYLTELAAYVDKKMRTIAEQT